MKYYHYPRFSRLYVVSHDSVLYKILDFVLLSGVEYCKYLRIFEISISIHGDSRILDISLCLNMTWNRKLDSKSRKSLDSKKCKEIYNPQSQMLRMCKADI